MFWKILLPWYIAGEEYLNAVRGKKMNGFTAVEPVAAANDNLNFTSNKFSKLVRK